MDMNPKKLFVALGFSLVASAPVWAEPPATNTNTELITQLEKGYGECESKARHLKGGPKLALLLHHRSMGKVIDQLKAGETVDANVLHRILVEHPS
jgi:hypothetical protein